MLMSLAIFLVCNSLLNRDIMMLLAMLLSPYRQIPLLTKRPRGRTESSIHRWHGPGRPDGTGWGCPWGHHTIGRVLGTQFNSSGSFGRTSLPCPHRCWRLEHYICCLRWKGNWQSHYKILLGYDILLGWLRIWCTFWVHNHNCPCTILCNHESPGAICGHCGPSRTLGQSTIAVESRAFDQTTTIP